MIIKHLEDFHRGWLIGDFDPSLFRTKDFEVGILTHKKGEKWPKHVHLVADEYNVLLEGAMSVNEVVFTAGDIFTILKGEVAEPVFLSDCKVLVIKVPSAIGDKYEIGETE